MNTVTLTPTTLTVEPTGLDKVWSFTRRIDVPLTQVRGATYDPGANQEPKGIRRPGLAVPGKWVGTFVANGEKTFWNVNRRSDTVVIQLADNSLNRLILTVDDPRATVDAINAAISGR